jgi:hypothetical protein
MRRASKLYGRFPGLEEITLHKRMKRVDVRKPVQYSYTFRSHDDMGVVQVKLQGLGDLDPEDRICPIGMEGFDQCVLEHDPTACFLDSARSHLCAGLLPCGHRFGVMTIVSHFAMSDLRCPICRAGVTARLDIGSLPRHLQAGLTERVLLSDKEELRAQTESDRQDVLHMFTSDSDDLLNMFMTPDINVTMYYFEGPQQIGTLEFRMQPVNEQEYEISATEVGRITQALTASGAATMRMTIHSRSFLNTMLRLSDTALVTVANIFIATNGDSLLQTDIPCITVLNSTDVLRMGRSSLSSSEITSVRWTSGRNIYHRLMSE